ncbi:reprolysin-like metallopeptidase [Streptomyces sp. NPDC089919]|uniref:InlB B-repeat-containing protein n=1 Tax=Streptomyces sp. NPDC089919 TaxID=3155188 RepID=UPI003426B218
MTTSHPVLRAGLAALCATAIVLPLAGAAPAATGTTARPGARGPARPATEGKEILRERTVPLDPADYRWLCGTRPFGAPREHVFDLFPDLRLRIVEDRLDHDGDSLTWTGHVRGEPSSNAVLSATGVCADTPDPASVGIDAHFDLGERVYRISMPRNEPGRLRITEEDPDQRKHPTGDDADQENPLPDPAVMRQGLERLRQRAAAGTDGPVVIDMIVGYTPAAAWRVGGDQAVQSRIRLAESYLNQAFADSNVQASVDVIGTYDTGYRGDQTAALMKEKLENPNDRDLGARAAQLRRQYGVDLVSVINDVPDGSSGNASLPMPISERSDDQAFSVVDVQSIVNWYNFGHEVGHNLGLWHDRATLDVQAGGQDYRPYLTTPYSTGYITPDRRFHTLMAYATACGQPCTAVNQYSNTENTVDGQPLGDRYNDNAAVARLTTPIVAGYRTLAVARQRYALTLTAGPGGTLRPSTYGPYAPGTTVTLTARPADGYRVAGWESDGVSYSYTGTEATVTMDRAHTVKVLFARR